MKWFRHESTDRNEIESKLIRSKFAAEGYGIYCTLQEVIAEYVEKDNIQEWGYVHPLHSIETLAQECSTTVEKLQDFLKFCDEKKIFEKKDGRLFCSLILKRLDTFAERTRREFVASSKPLRTDLAHRKEEKIREKKKEEKYSSIISLTEGVVQAVATDYSVPVKAVRDLKDALILHCKSKGKSYRDYRATLMNWVRRGIAEGKLTKIRPSTVPIVQEISPEEQAIVSKKIQEIRAKNPMKSL